MKKVATLTLLAGWVVLAGATHASAQGKGNSPGIAQLWHWTNAIRPRSMLHWALTNARTLRLDSAPCWAI